MKARTCTALLILLSATITADERVAVLPTLEIEDADTLVVEFEGEVYRVQLPDIDAPESTPNPKLQRDLERTGLSAQALLGLGRAAEAGLRKLLEEFSPYTLQFDPRARDRYGRVPGDLHDGSGRALSTRLVAQGLAVPLPGSSGERGAELVSALAAAREGRYGLWGTHPEVFGAWAGNTPAPTQ